MRRSISTATAFKFALFAALIAASCLLDACTTCDTSVSHCNGTHVIGCEWDGDGPFASVKQTDTDCPVACSVFGTTAACVDSLVPVTECAAGDGPHCWNNGPTLCRGGFPTSSSQACDGGTTCVLADECADGAMALCDVTATPDPSCANTDSYCDGATSVQCQCGFSVALVSCGDASHCRNVDGPGICTLSGDVDPRCPASSGFSAFCASGTGFTCWQGVPIDSVGCGDGTCAVTSQGMAECEFQIQTGG